MFFGKRDRKSKSTKSSKPPKSSGSASEKRNCLEAKLLYENGSIQMWDGSLFDPLKESVERWIVTFPSGYRLGTHCRVVYGTTNGHWVEVEYACCSLENTKQGTLWCSESPPQGMFIEPIKVAHFLLENQFALPESLKAVYTEWVNDQKKPKPPILRPDKHWLQLYRDDLDRQAFRGSTTLKDILTPLADGLTEFLQDLEMSNSRQSKLGKSCNIRLLLRDLYAKVIVDQAKWDWQQKGVPPQSIDWLELDWSEDLDDIRPAVQKLRKHVQGPLMCLGIYSAPSRPGSPSEAEVKQAKERIHEQLSVLRDLIREIVVPIKTWQKMQQELERVVSPTYLQQPVPTDREIESPTQSLNPDHTCADNSPLNKNSSSTPVEQGPVFERNAEGIPILRLVADGFYYDGKFQPLSATPLSLLAVMASARDGRVSREQIVQTVWSDQPVEDNTVSVTLTAIRKALRLCLFLTEKAEPIPSFGKRDSKSWQLAVQYELVDDRVPS